jgi:putative pyruvate formate lyase activating enzyme
MDQYRPAYKAHHFPELNRRVTRHEYQAAVEMAQDAGLNRLDERRAMFWVMR